MNVLDPLVSIIVPARNVAAYIATAIESVLQQSYSNWQLIIVENDCEDNTSDIIKQFIDQRIIHVITDIRGLSHARNIGLDRSSGEFICFLDADDRLAPDSLSMRVKKFQSDPSVQFVDGKVVLYNYSFSRVIRVWTPSFVGIPDKEMGLLIPRCFSGITWMLRRAAIAEHRFDTNWTHLEDRVFFLGLADRGKYDFIDDEVYHVRRRPGSLMSQHKQLEEAYARFLDLAHSRNLFDAGLEKSQRTAFHKMFFRTYLKHLHPIKAMRHYFAMFTEGND